MSGRILRQRSLTRAGRAGIEPGMTMIRHPDGRPLVMGIVNVTPDSFSDGGRYLDARKAAGHALGLLEDGADWLDVGGESTRPGAEPVDAATEAARVVPVIEAIRRAAPHAKISIDTMKPDVARAAFAAGAAMWNDVNALRAPGALAAAAALGGSVALMHMKGEPRTMQDAPVYDDVVGEVEAFLLERAEAAMAAGVARDAVWIDPGIGFGKTTEHNLALTRATARLAGHGFPLLYAASRKRFIGALDGGAPADRRLGGSLAAALHAARQGASMVRVHDVRETVQALKIQAVLG